MAEFKVVLEYAPFLLKTLQWFPISNRINACVLPMASKALCDLAPAYLSGPLSYPWITVLRSIVINTHSSTLFAFASRQRRTAGRTGDLHLSTDMAYTFSSHMSWCDHHLSGCSLRPLPLSLSSVTLITASLIVHFCFLVFCFHMFCFWSHKNISVGSFLFTTTYQCLEKC